MINNLSSTNSIYRNCESDASIPLLNNLHELIVNYKKNENSDAIAFQTDGDNETKLMQNIAIDPLFSVADVNFVEDKAISCDSSVICRKLLKITHCQDCINTLQTSNPQAQTNEDNLAFGNPNATTTFIDILRATDPQAQIDEDNFSFGSPTATFTRNFKNLHRIVKDIIPSLCAEKNLKKKIIAHIETLEFDEIGCPQHETILTSKLKELTVHFGIILFCKNINSILSGKITSIPVYANNIENLALSIKKKRKNIGKHSDIFQSK